MDYGPSCLFLLLAKHRVDGAGHGLGQSGETWRAPSGVSNISRKLFLDVISATHAGWDARDDNRAVGREKWSCEKARRHEHEVAREVG